MIKSSNTQGNPWHSESNGQFTSPKKEDLDASMEGLKDFIEQLKNQSNNTASSTPSLKLKPGALKALAPTLKIKQGAASVLAQILQSKKGPAGRDLTTDVDKIIDRVFELAENKEFVTACASKIDFYYIHPNSNVTFLTLPNGQKCKSDVFIQTLSEMKFNKGRAQEISAKDYQQIMSNIYYQGVGQFNAAVAVNQGHLLSFRPKEDLEDMERNIEDSDKMDIGCGYLPVFRGLNFSGSNPKGTFDHAKQVYLGQVDGQVPAFGGGAMDTCHYWSTDKGYSVWYAHNSSDQYIIKGLVDLKGIKATSQDLSSSRLRKVEIKIKNDVNFKNKLRTAFAKNISDPDQAQKISDMFIRTLTNDFGLINIICGFDAVVGEYDNGNQFDLYNLQKLKILN